MMKAKTQIFILVVVLAVAVFVVSNEDVRFSALQRGVSQTGVSGAQLKATSCTSGLTGSNYCSGGNVVRDYQSCSTKTVYAFFDRFGDGGSGKETCSCSVTGAQVVETCSDGCEAGTCLAGPGPVDCSGDFMKFETVNDKLNLGDELEELVISGIVDGGHLPRFLDSGTYQTVDNSGLWL